VSAACVDGLSPTSSYVVSIRPDLAGSSHVDHVLTWRVGNGVTQRIGWKEQDEEERFEWLFIICGFWGGGVDI
jgi:hypothetical protein